MRRGGHIHKRGLAAATVGVALIGGAVLSGMSRRFAVVDESMRPNFEPDDWVIAQRRRGVPKRGDVVVFTHPSYPDLFILKRVIGLPGERVSSADGQICIDSRVLADPWGDGPMCADSDDVVPGDTVWVLGDNRCGSSVDSRVLGAIPVTDVGWKVVARYWPPGRAGRL
ncbi:MAG: signal peptidase I [Actinomycetia bacterium]|nr:signal peptidase I [Actinomycetes bacterium]